MGHDVINMDHGVINMDHNTHDMINMGHDVINIDDLDHYLKTKFIALLTTTLYRMSRNFGGTNI